MAVASSVKSEPKTSKRLFGRCPRPFRPSYGLFVPPTFSSSRIVELPMIDQLSPISGQFCEWRDGSGSELVGCGGVLGVYGADGGHGTRSTRRHGDTEGFWVCFSDTVQYLTDAQHRMPICEVGTGKAPFGACKGALVGKPGAFERVIVCRAWSSQRSSLLGIVERIVSE
jgi:hypothetical protein